jgi:hypothetical protein
VSHEVINYVWNEWNESVTVPVYKKGNKTGYSSYHGDITVVCLIQNVIQYPPLKVKSDS